MTRLINDLAETITGRQHLLVLDDYHLINAPSIHQAFTFLLDHLPPPPMGLHVVIAGRTDPSLPLSRLRAGGQMTEIRAADLRFTLDEITIFLDKLMGLTLSAENVAALEIGARALQDEIEEAGRERDALALAYRWLDEAVRWMQRAMEADPED